MRSSCSGFWSDDPENMRATTYGMFTSQCFRLVPSQEHDHVQSYTLPLLSPIPLVRLDALTIPLEPTCHRQGALSRGGQKRRSWAAARMIFSPLYRRKNTAAPF